MKPRSEEAAIGWPYWQQVQSVTAEEFSVLRHGRDPRKFSLARQGNSALKREIEADIRLAASDPPVRASGVLAFPLRRWIAWAKKHRLECPGVMVKPRARRPAVR